MHNFLLLKRLQHVQYLLALFEIEQRKFKVENAQTYGYETAFAAEDNPAVQAAVADEDAPPPETPREVEDRIFKLNVEIDLLEDEMNSLHDQLEEWDLAADFSELPPERQEELIRSQTEAQGTFGTALGDIQEELVSMYIENIMDVMEVDELMSIIERFPGGGLIQRYVNKVNCSIQGLNNPPNPSFLSTLSFDPCGEGNLGLSVPDKLKDFKMPRVYNKSFLRILRNKFIATVETMMTQILVKMILKLIQK